MEFGIVRISYTQPLVESKQPRKNLKTHLRRCQKNQGLAAPLKAWAKSIQGLFHLDKNLCDTKTCRFVKFCYIVAVIPLKLVMPPNFNSMTKFPTAKATL